MVDSVWAADFLSVVERRGAVAVGNDEDMRGREDLQGSFKSVGDKASGLVAGDHETGIGNIGRGLGLGSVVGRWRVLLE